MCRVYEGRVKLVLQILHIYTSGIVFISYVRAHLTKSTLKYRAFNMTIKNNNRYINCVRCAEKHFSHYSEKQAYKPERSHHCSMCRKCGLKMDHHCPFIMNCVTGENHRFFFQLLFNGFVGGLFCILHLAHFVLTQYQGYMVYYTKPTLFFILVALIAVVIGEMAYFFTSMCMGYNAMKMILGNFTTIESMKFNGRDLYDLGKLYNLKEFFGNLVMFLLPVKKSFKYEQYWFKRRGKDNEHCSTVFEQTDFKREKFKLEYTIEIDEFIKDYQGKLNKQDTQGGRKEVLVFNSIKINLD